MTLSYVCYSRFLLINFRKKDFILEKWKIETNIKTRGMQTGDEIWRIKHTQVPTLRHVYVCSFPRKTNKPCLYIIHVGLQHWIDREAEDILIHGSSRLWNFGDTCTVCGWCCPISNVRSRAYLDGAAKPHVNVNYDSGSLSLDSIYVLIRVYIIYFILLNENRKFWNRTNEET